MPFSCSLTTLRYFNYLALLTKNWLKKTAKEIVHLREIYNKKCNFSFCFAKQKGYNNNYIHILDSVSFKSAFLVHARGTQGTLRYWNICDASFENGSSNIWNIDAKSDLTARLSSILWNWVILIHQRIMYLSNQTALMCRLIWSYTFHICPKNPFRMTRIILSCLPTGFLGTSMNARIKTVR